MFNLFKKKTVKRPAFNFETIGVDLHSHLIPGIDDGAQTLGESLELIHRMAAMGIKKVITTPHIMADYYRNTPEIINSGLLILQEAVKNDGLDLVIEAAAEHYLDELFESRIEAGTVMTIGDKYVLFELSFVNEPQNLIPIIQKLKDYGYKPILAHPERYPYLTLDQYKNIKSWGCDFQLNTISLTGYYGKPVKKMAEELVDNMLIDFISSDMHHLRHAEALENSLSTRYVEKLLFDYELKNKLLL